MQFASEVTDKLHLPPDCNTDCSGCKTPVTCGPRTYEQRLRVQRNRLSATYVGTEVAKVSGTNPDDLDFLQLNDGGNPRGLVQFTEPSTFTLVNTPVYITPPTNPVSSFNITQNAASTLTFTITVKASNCCRC